MTFYINIKYNIMVLCFLLFKIYNTIFSYLIPMVTIILTCIYDINLIFEYLSLVRIIFPHLITLFSFFFFTKKLIALLTVI